MKTIKYWMTMFIAIMTLGMMTSCEEDTQVAVCLDGEWRGDFGMNYTIERRGQRYTFDSYDTYMVFYNDGILSTHGWGKQVDYYKYGPYEYMYYRFNWSVRDGILYLSYPSNPELNTAIHDYAMSYWHFRGYFGNSNVYFDMSKLDTDYNWDCYRNDYYYCNRPSWSYGPYYSPTRSQTDETAQDSTQTDNEFKIVGRGNRFTQTSK